jgi:hypothetical protein
MARTTRKPRPRPSREQVQREALCSALAERSTTNYETIIEGFTARGLSPDDIVPRENVFTYNAWLALGRQVRKGEQGVKVVTWIESKKKTEEAAEGEAFKFPRSVTVFHVTQTDAQPVA